MAAAIGTEGPSWGPRTVSCGAEGQGSGSLLQGVRRARTWGVAIGPFGRELWCDEVIPGAPGVDRAAVGASGSDKHSRRNPSAVQAEGIPLATA
jgi:hypothetical protein